MGDHKHRRGSIEDAAEGLAEGLRIKCCEALVEDDNGCILEERSGNIEAAPFTMGELPTRLADQLQHPSRHSVKEVSEAELAADDFSLLQIFGPRRPAAAHQEVEGEGSCEDVVLMELWCGYHLPPPTRRPQGLPVEAPKEEQPGLRGAQADKEGCEGGLAATGEAFEKDAVTRADPQIATSKNGLALLVVTEAEIVRLKE